MDLEKRIARYAQLLIVKGCALKEGQELFINAPVQTLEFTQSLVKCAYEHGASYVTVNWTDGLTNRYGFEYASLERFEQFPAWNAQRNNSIAQNGAAVLTILSDDPQLMQGLDQRKMVARIVAAHDACKEYYDAIDAGKSHWCIAGAASEQWATRVFAHLNPEDATLRLWEAILDAARVDEDPLAAWDAHRASFDARKDWLNSQNFKALHYRASNGTDLVVGLLDKAHWEGGGQEAADGSYFFPNIPTEEVFTSPDRMQVHGIVKSALPLIHNGAPVEDFWIRFEAGKAVEWDARIAKDILDGIIGTDENSCRLGECALGPFSSPIRTTGILFFETLFDENASCHLAFGKGFPECYENGYEMSCLELLNAGVNDSAAHVDFMIGTKDLSIVGIRPDGSEIDVFVNGDWAVNL